MRAGVIASLIIAVLLSGCGGGGSGNQANLSVNSSETPTPAREAEKPTPTTSVAATPAVIEATAIPVEYTYLGISPSKDAFSYKIRVNTTKPVSQVDINAKYTDASGKVLEETTVAWQNVVKSVRGTIEQGKTYEVEGYLPEGAAKVESALKRVIFTDGTRWEAK
jgi:hypothetical protein